MLFYYTIGNVVSYWTPKINSTILVTLVSYSTPLGVVSDTIVTNGVLFLGMDDFFIEKYFIAIY